MKWVSLYLLGWLVGITGAFIYQRHVLTFFSLQASDYAAQIFQCALMGALGTLAYCIRGVYEAVSVRADWDDRWIAWYVLRPFVGLISGTVAWVVLRGGVVALSGSGANPSANIYAYWFLAFVAGLNVKNFLNWLEFIARDRLGISPSRVASGQHDNRKENS